MLEPYAALAAEPIILVVLAAWGFGEAIALPVVPDVLLGILALAAPWLLAPLLGVTIAGALVGSLVAWWLALHRAAAFESLLFRLPGLGIAGLAEARARIVRAGPARGFAQVGPGLPLKAYLHALAGLEPEAPVGRVAGLALLNRVTRIVPVTLVFAALHPLAVTTDVSPAALGIAYVTGWTAFYLAYWHRRGRTTDAGGGPPGSPNNH